MSEVLSVLNVKDEDGNWIKVPGLKGEDGVGIASVTFQQDGTLTIIDTEGETKTFNGIKMAIQSVDDMIIISDTQPSSATNKIWIDSDSDTVQIPTMEDLFASFISETASGEVAQFADGAESMPVKSMTVDLPYKADGYSSVVISKNSRNLSPKVMPSNVIAGVFDANDTKIRNASNARIFYIRCKPNVQYKVKLDTRTGLNFGLSNEIPAVGSSVQYLGSMQNREDFEFVAGQYVYLLFKLSNLAQYETILDRHLMITIGENTYEFEEGEPQENYTVDLSNVGATIYGGNIDVTKGKVTSTMDENGDPLGTPVVYDISPITITTFHGSNVIFSDAGNVTVDYHADTKLYIDSLSNSGT